jgi:hypothetical protein
MMMKKIMGTAMPGPGLAGLLAVLTLLAVFSPGAGAQEPQAVQELMMAKKIYRLDTSTGPQTRAIPVTISAEGFWGPLPKDSRVLQHYQNAHPVRAELGAAKGRDGGRYIFVSAYQKPAAPVSLQVHLPQPDEMGLVQSGGGVERKYSRINSARVEFDIKEYSVKPPAGIQKLIAFKLDPVSGKASWTPTVVEADGKTQILAPVVVDVLVTFEATSGVLMNGVSLPGFDKQSKFTRRIARLVLPVCGMELNRRLVRCPGPADPAITWQAKRVGPLGIAIPSHWAERYEAGGKSAFWSLGGTQPPEAGIFVGLDKSEPGFIKDLEEVRKDLVSISGYLADSYSGWSPGKKARANFVVFRNQFNGLVLTAGMVSTSWEQYQSILEAIRGSLSIERDPVLPQIAAGLSGPDIGRLAAPPPKPVETVSDTALSFPDESGSDKAATKPEVAQAQPAPDTVLSFPDEPAPAPAPAPAAKPQPVQPVAPAPAPQPMLTKPIAPPVATQPQVAAQPVAPAPATIPAPKPQAVTPSPAPATPPAPAVQAKPETASAAPPAGEKALEEGPLAKQPAERPLTREEQEILAYELFRKLSKIPSGNLEAIEKIYRAVIEKCPVTERAQIAYWQLSNQYLQAYEKPKWEKTVDLLESFLEKYPDSPGVPPVTQRLIQAYEESGSWCNAAELYGKTVPDLKADPDQVRSVYSQYANALFQCGQNDLAKEWYQKVLDLDPEGASLEARAAQEQLEYLAKHAEAEAAANQPAPWIAAETTATAPWLKKPDQPEPKSSASKEPASAKQAEATKATAEQAEATKATADTKPTETAKAEDIPQAKTEPAKEGGPETIEFFKPEVPTPLKMSLHVFKPVVFLGEKLQFAARVSGGVPPYTFTWNKAYTRTTEKMQHNVNMPTKIPGKGPVTVEVTDAVGQTASASLLVEVKHKEFEDVPLFQPVETKPKPAPPAAEPLKLAKKPEPPQAKPEAAQDEPKAQPQAEPVKLAAEPVKPVEKAEPAESKPEKQPEAAAVKPGTEPQKQVKEPEKTAIQPDKPITLPVKKAEKPAQPEAKLDIPVKPGQPEAKEETKLEIPVEPSKPAAKPGQPAEPVKAAEQPVKPQAKPEQPAEPTKLAEKPQTEAKPEKPEVKQEKPEEPAKLAEKLETEAKPDKPAEPAKLADKPEQPAEPTKLAEKPEAPKSKPEQPADAAKEAEKPEQPAEPTKLAEKPEAPESKPEQPAESAKEAEKPEQPAEPTKLAEKPEAPESKPEQPAESAKEAEKPAQPAEPTKLAEKPEAPESKPEQPAEPAKEAEKPAQPAEPAKLTEKPLTPESKPEQPAEPAKEAEKPEQPAEPSKLAEKPEAPESKPEQPAEPAKEAEKPEQPAEPTKLAEKPEAPESKPEQPSEPAKEAEKPAQPAEPTKLTEQPETPESKPEQPSEPAKEAEKPEQPAEPTKLAEKPETPESKPEQPAESAKEAEKPAQPAEPSKLTETPETPESKPEQPSEPAKEAEKPAQPAEPTKLAEKPDTPESKPKQPSEPAKEAEKPAQPAEPTKLAEKPDTPESKPEQPSEPAKEAEKPAQPAEPTKLAEKPDTPESKPEQPAEPAKEAEKPAQPAEPTKLAEKPDTPESKPEQPAEPAKEAEKPEQPVEPSKLAEKPDTPESKPEQPAEPAKEAEKPAQPAEPTKLAEKPDTPESKPEQPSEPAKEAEKPEQPAEPTKLAEKPETPESKPEQPAEPAKEAEKPAQPAEPTKLAEKPEAPESKPEQPAEAAKETEKPEQPAEPTKLAEKPEAPESKPEQPAEAAKETEKPEQPAEPTKLAEKPEAPESKPEQPSEPAKLAEKPEKPEAKPEKPTETAKKPEQTQDEKKELNPEEALLASELDELKKELAKVVERELAKPVPQPPKPEPLKVTLLADRNNAKQGDTVTYTAKVTKGIPPYKYDWNIKSKSTKDRQQATHSAKIQMNIAGKRTISVTVTDGGGRIGKAATRVQIDKAIEALQVDVKVEKPTVVQGGQLLFTTTVDGGQAPYTYKYGSRNPFIRTTKDPTHLVKFKMKTLGVRRMKVQVKDSKGRVGNALVKVEVLPKEQALGLDVLVDKARLKQGETLMITTEVSGGKPPYTYSYGSKKPYVATKDEPLHRVRFIMKKPGERRMKVKVSDSQGLAVEDVAVFTVEPPE